MEEHQCRVNGCNNGRGKTCVHVLVKCANCGGNHLANSNRCALRHKAETDARKEKNLRKTLEKAKARAEETGEEEDEDQDSSSDIDTGI